MDKWESSRNLVSHHFLIISTELFWSPAENAKLNQVFTLRWKQSWKKDRFSCSQFSWQQQLFIWVCFGKLWEVHISICLQFGSIQAIRSYTPNDGYYPIDFNDLMNSCWVTIITMLTVGFGDGYPSTHLGRFIGTNSNLDFIIEL